MIQEVKYFQEYLIKKKRDLKTIQSYSTDVELFLQSVKKPIHIIDELDIEKYKAFLFDEGYKLSSINRKLVAINLFLKHNDRHLDISLEKLQMQSFLDNVIEVDEFIEIIKQAEIKNDYRAIALLSTMYYTGMRVSEMLSLTIRDVESDSLLIKGKGKKYRTVFIPQKLRDIWKTYLQYRVNKGDKLFTGQRGSITRVHSNNIFKKYAELAGISTKKAHNHNLRHLYCRRIINKGLDISTLADLVGHSDINVTRRYLIKSKQELLDIINDL